MNRQHYIGWSLAVFAVLVAVCCMGAAAWWMVTAGAAMQSPGSWGTSIRDTSTGGIDPKVVAAWEKAGAKFGWMCRKDDDPPVFYVYPPKSAVVVPAFKFRELPKEFADLPAPGVSFGLSLDGVKLTDGDIRAVAGLKQLQVLDLTWTNISDAGLKELAGLPHLRELSLGSTKISDAGLKELAGFKQLQVLVLSGTPISDAGLKELAGLKQLRVLGVGSTPISDAGLKELAGLQQLRYLDLCFNFDVTHQGVAELQKALPACEIWH
jgi:hypothetical protein